MADKTFKRERNRSASAPSVQSGDPAMRRRALMIVVAGAVLGGAIILLTGGYRRQLTDWAQDDPARALNLLLPAMAVTIVLPVLGIAWYFWRLGASTVRELRFPPAHVTWANAAPPVHGAAARRRGRFLQWCAAALVVIIVVFTAVLAQLVTNLKSALDGGGPV
jgi:Ca2+/H+ antiporter